jgi:single-strand DNA-binding protein
MINKVILIGHVGRDPESKQLDSGVAVVNFSVATSETYKNKSGEKVTDTEWHNVVAWRGLAEMITKFVKKGDLVYIEGKNKTESYDKNGEKRYITKVVADQFKFMPSGKKETEPKQADPEPEQNDLPF